MSYNIGLNVVEVDGRATPSIQPAPTSVTGFAIRAQRGIPEQVVRVTNWSQFVEHFGSYVDGAYGAYAVRGFFDNGGATAYVTRVVNAEPAEPVATAASITSEPGPWALKPGGTLTFRVYDTEVSPDTPVAEATGEFTATPARLEGKTGPFNLDGGDDSGKVIGFIVNGVTRGPYQFVEGDFEGGLAEATTAEVAAVLNREFSGIQVWVDPEGEILRTRTDQRGSGASLMAPESIEEVETAATELGFEADVEDKGGGNVANIEAVTSAEAVAVISDAFEAELEPETLSVSPDGTRVKIEHSKTGVRHVIQVSDPYEPEVEGSADTSVHESFGFDTERHSGDDGSAAFEAVASTRELQDAIGNPALTVTAGYRGVMDRGAWGDDITIRIVLRGEDAQEDEAGTYDLFVRYKDKDVETWEKLNNSDDPEANGHHVKEIINDEFTGSKYIQVTEKLATNPATTSSDTYDDADKDGFVPLMGGDDGAFADDGELNAFAGSFDLFKLHEIQLLCCPEADDEVVLRAGIDHCQLEGDRMFVGHTPKGYEFGDAKGYAQEFRGDKVYGALYFPWIRVRDPIGNQKWIPPTGHVLGVYARTERERGIWKAPAGNAARLNGALDVEKRITNVDHTDLVKSGNVNAVRFVPGQGIVIDSSRSLGTSPLWLYVNVRLLFNYVKSSLKAGLRWVVQEPNDDTLWNKVKYNSVTPFLMGLWRRGAFGPGAPEDVFTVKCDAENNPPANIQQGLFNLEVYFYPSRPAETIVIIVGQQEGGATASEG